MATHHSRRSARPGPALGHQTRHPRRRVACVSVAYIRKQPVLGPHDAVHRCRWRGADRAHRESRGRGVRRAVVALGARGQNRLHLAEEARSAALDERHLRHDAHLVHPAPRLQIVKRAQHDVERVVVVHVELHRLDVGVVRDDRDVRVERTRRLLGDCGLGLLNVLLLKQKLPVQVR